MIVRCSLARLLSVQLDSAVFCTPCNDLNEWDIKPLYYCCMLDHIPMSFHTVACNRLIRMSLLMKGSSNKLNKTDGTKCASD